jgi:hypothetical protein
MGVSVTGIDGPYVDKRRVLIDAKDFHAVDPAAPIGLARQFDLVQSLEVAEHLPAAKAGQFVDTLIPHGPIFWPNDEAEFNTLAAGFDTLIYIKAPPQGLEFTPQLCFRQACVARRSGGCAALPMLAMPFPVPVPRPRDGSP